MIAYRILPEHQLIILWNIGHTSIRECIEHDRIIKNDPEHSRDYDVITDITQQEKHYSAREIWQMIHHAASYTPGNRPKKNAIIAPCDRGYGTSRMYEQLSESVTPYETAVFRDWPSALKWLSKSPEILPELLIKRRTLRSDIPILRRTEKSPQFNTYSPYAMIW
jgi:hypothetical protein